MHLGLFATLASVLCIDSSSVCGDVSGTNVAARFRLRWLICSRSLWSIVVRSVRAIDGGQDEEQVCGYSVCGRLFSGAACGQIDLQCGLFVGDGLEGEAERGARLPSEKTFDHWIRVGEDGIAGWHQL